MKKLKLLLPFLFIILFINCSKEGDSAPETQELEPPTNLNLDLSNSNKINISWNIVENAEEYIIYRAIGNSTDNPENLSFQSIGQSTLSFFDDFNLIGNSSYFYKVKSTNSETTSDFSQAVFANIIEQLIDPSDPNAIAGVLIIDGNVTTGPPPPSSTNPNAPIVSGNQSSATVSNDNTLYLPFNYTSTSGSGSGYGGCYVQVNGASTYWAIPFNNASPQNGQIVIPIGIPANVDNGEFCITYCIYDNNNQVSNLLTTCITIAPPKNCPGFESGSDGLTIFTYDLGQTSGNVTINYDTYSIPDRIDLFYNGIWIDGTGSALGQNQFPPVMDCSGIIVDGYVGTMGSFNFNYNPANGSTIDVYISGCIGGGTAWDIGVNCPQ